MAEQSMAEQAAAAQTVTMVYTDGACRGNPGKGGWGWIVPDGPSAGQHAGKSGSGGDPQTTNQRMELKAVLEAVQTLDGPLEIYSDSSYVTTCFRDGWWQGWVRREWRNSEKKLVANRDLWEPLIEQVQMRDINFEWVKAHSGDKWNDVADLLATEAADSQPDVEDPEQTLF